MSLDEVQSEARAAPMISVRGKTATGRRAKPPPRLRPSRQQ